jgi:hypothetical protein
MRARLEFVGHMQALRPRRRLQRACEQICDPGAFDRQRLEHRRAIGKAERGGDACTRQRIVRQAVRLFVAQHLHAILGAAQEQISAAQPRRGVGIEMSKLLGRGQRVEQTRRTQLGFAAGTNQLQQLHREFDLADAARTEFQVLFALAPLDFGVDARLQFAQAFDRGEVEVLAIHEGAQARDQFGPGFAITSDAAPWSA